MSESLKISGKTYPVGEDFKLLKWETHPGGLLTATVQNNEGLVRRIRMRGSIRGNHFWYQIDGKSYCGEKIQRSKQSEDGDDEGQLEAQFPSKVLDVKVKIGQKVTSGQVLLVVEAMKMEFTVKAPYDGKVTQVHVKKGLQISPGVHFLDIDKKKAKK